MTSLAGVIASIPSPSDGSIEVGPLRIHAYGLMIALGVIAAVWLFGRRLEQKKIGTRDDANSISMWAVIAGVIGSRLYHVATDWSKFEHNLSKIPRIWEGGLGIPGGLIAGISVGLWVAHRRRIPLARCADAAAPAIALAQAIGRWGNYFNQELFGRPTTLPWGLEIEASHAPAQYVLSDGTVSTLFHPTFLYESLGTFLLCGILLLIDKKVKVRPGHLMAMYLIGYGIIRFFVEGLRIDEAHHVGGLRWNQWVALAAVVGGVLYLVISNLLHRGDTIATEAVDDADVAGDRDRADEVDEAEPLDEVHDVHDFDGADEAEPLDESTDGHTGDIGERTDPGNESDDVHGDVSVDADSTEDTSSESPSEA